MLPKYLLWHALFYLVLLLTALKRHDTLRAGTLDASFAVTLGDALSERVSDADALHDEAFAQFGWLTERMENKWRMMNPWTEEGESNKVPEQLSVHDAGEEDGTSSGPCTFAVHGLSGEHYNNMKTDALKAKALTHLANGGQTLGVGHAETPEPTWKNVQLYPQMFPWLFPYGLGGIGHESHKKRFSEGKHKHHLLMYHDKRFQTDL
ncbi:hypothetical protein K438DRAFT_1968663 [Mycena galopus ATCC 62051]|nr:hypothetical protein K438DRAFT_1968663 [Mycena galopus ATCC 62051]